MRQFYECYRRHEILSALLTELPWTHHLLIIGQSKVAEEREFYLRLAIREKWSGRERERQFRTSLSAHAVLNPPILSTALRELHPQAAGLFKDVYSLEFLGLPANHSEGDLHGALLCNLSRFLTELGRDFCFIGSQHPIQVGGQDLERRDTVSRSAIETAKPDKLRAAAERTIALLRERRDDGKIAVPQS